MRGGATFAYQSNMEGEMIKLLGDWASDTYERYVDISMDKRYDSMKQFVESLNRICDSRQTVAHTSTHFSIHT